MPESQSIEYKSNWWDEHLKWICGFANANGGRLYIGIDDKGKITGIEAKTASSILRSSLPVMTCPFL